MGACFGTSLYVKKYVRMMELLIHVFLDEGLFVTILNVEMFLKAVLDNDHYRHHCPFRDMMTVTAFEDLLFFYWFVSWNHGAHPWDNWSNSVVYYKFTPQAMRKSEKKSVRKVLPAGKNIEHVNYNCSVHKARKRPCILPGVDKQFAVFLIWTNRIILHFFYVLF